jgi:hypothetical protein
MTRFGHELKLLDCVVGVQYERIRGLLARGWRPSIRFGSRNDLVRSRDRAVLKGNRPPCCHSSEFQRRVVRTSIRHSLTILMCMTALSLFVAQSDIRAEETSHATISDPKAAQVSALIRRAIELATAQKSAEADEAYRAALTAAEQWEGAEGWNVAGILEWQAAFFRDQQRYDEAWAAAERGLLIRKQKVGPYHFLKLQS